MARRPCIEICVFGEGEPIKPVDGRYDGVVLQKRTNKPEEVIFTGKLAISTLLYNQGYHASIASDLARGFEERFTPQPSVVEAEKQPDNYFYEYNLDDITSPLTPGAIHLRYNVGVCAEITGDFLEEHGVLPLWRQGITLYGAPSPGKICIAALTCVDKLDR